MSNDGCEHHALDESGDYVAQINGREDIMDVEKWRQASAEEHEQPTGQYAEEIRNDAEARNGNQSSQILGGEDKLDWLERHDAEGIEFLGDLHRPDLSRKRRPGAPAHRNRRE